MKYQALEELLDQARAVGEKDALAAMWRCVDAWASIEVVNAAVGAFYELGLDPEKMEIEKDGSKFTVYSKELEPLGKDDLDSLRDVVEELFEKRMGDLYGIYLDVSFPGAYIGTMVMRLDIHGQDRRHIASIFLDKASRI